MTDLRARAAPRRAGSSLALVVVLMIVLASAIDDPAWVNGRGSAHRRPRVVCALLGRRGRVHRAQGGLGPLDDARRRRPVRGAADPDPRRLGGRARARRSARRSGSPPTASSRPTSTLAWRSQQFTDQEVHYILVLGAIVWAARRSSPSYAVFGHRRPLNAVVMVGHRPAGEHVDHRSRPAAVPRRVHRRVAVPADRDARVRRAGDVDPAPDRRPEHDLVALPARRHRVHPRRDGRARCCSPRAPPRARWRAPGTGSTTSSSRSARRSGGCCPVGGDAAGGGGVSFGSTRADPARSGSATTTSPSRATVPADDPKEPLLAGGDVRHVRPRGLGPDDGRGDARSRPARRCWPAPPRSPIPSSRSHDQGHGPARRLPRHRACSRRARRRPSTGRRTCHA